MKGMTKSSGALQVLDMRYLDITEAHVSKLAESHLTSEGLRYDITIDQSVTREVM